MITNLNRRLTEILYEDININQYYKALKDYERKIEFSYSFDEKEEKILLDSFIKSLIGVVDSLRGILSEKKTKENYIILKNLAKKINLHKNKDFLYKNIFNRLTDLVEKLILYLKNHATYKKYLKGISTFTTNN